MSDRWWEIQILCHPALEESACWRLEEFGCSGAATEEQGQDRRIRAYLPYLEEQAADFGQLDFALTLDALSLDLPEPQVQWQVVAAEDWANSWKQYWQPQEVGDRLLLYPAWLAPPANSERLLVRLDPGAAFGTGNHPTTQLCLEALEMRLSQIERPPILADIGCGSGILSIAAILLGAGQVYAVDTDPLAVRAARHNCQLNGIEPPAIALVQGSVEQLLPLVPDGVEGILCNILAGVIIELIPQLTQLARPNCWGILSGILLEQAGAVADTLDRHGWTIGAVWKQQEWCCLNVRLD